MPTLKEIFDLGNQRLFEHNTIPKRKALVLEHLSDLGITEDADIRRTLSHAVRMAHIRYENLLQRGGTPATDSLENRMPHGKDPLDWHLKGKTTSELLGTFLRAQHFNSLKTSTVSGYTDWRDSVIKGLQEKRGITLTAPVFERFWKAYRRYKELNADLEREDKREYKYQIFERLSEMIIEDLAEDPEDVVARLEQENLKLAEEVELAQQQAMREMEQGITVTQQEIDDEEAEYYGFV